MVGGGFGGKEDITVEVYLALLTKATQLPVRLVYTREESTLAHSKRHPYIIRHRTGVKRDGRITASQVKVISDSGAYPYLSPMFLLYTTYGARPLPHRQRAGRLGRRGHQQPVHQRVPRLRRPASLLRLRGANGRHRRRAGPRPLRSAPPQLLEDRRHQRHRPAHRDRGMAGGDGDAVLDAGKLEAGNSKLEARN